MWPSLLTGSWRDGAMLSGFSPRGLGLAPPELLGPPGRQGAGAPPTPPVRAPTRLCLAQQAACAFKHASPLHVNHWVRHTTGLRRTVGLVSAPRQAPDGLCNRASPPKLGAAPPEALGPTGRRGAGAPSTSSVRPDTPVAASESSAAAPSALGVTPVVPPSDTPLGAGRCVCASSSSRSCPRHSLASCTHPFDLTRVCVSPARALSAKQQLARWLPCSLASTPATARASDNHRRRCNLLTVHMHFLHTSSSQQGVSGSLQPRQPRGSASRCCLRPPLSARHACSPARSGPPNSA